MKNQQQLEDAFFVRKEVFIKEQHVSRLKSHRSLGVGNLIIQALEEEAAKQGASQFMLNAQTQAVPFYEKHGYKVVSEEFSDANIPHVKMVKK